MSNNSFVPNRALSFLLLLLVSLAAHGTALAQGSAFTYQGRLTDGGNPANGQYDLQFQLFDTATVGTGTQQGSPVIVPNVTVTAGIFTVQLDFGAVVFPGANRFLEIAVKQTGGSTFTTLGPRQPVTSTPYAVRSATSASADTATNSTQLGGLSASGFIQNTTTQQGTTNFNVSGDGTAGGTLSGNVLNATTQYNIGGIRVLSVAGTNNTFAGINAGAANTTGIYNSFFGNAAGQANTTGGFNSFFGRGAGAANTTATGNSFFGNAAGQFNTTGSSNAFFGGAAGGSNTTGSFNSFFGQQAGTNNTTGSSNSFFGWSAGQDNSTGFSNSFFGERAGLSNTTGNSNSFFGREAGLSNSTGNSNAFFGTNTGRANTTGFTNSFFGAFAGVSNTTGLGNSFFGAGAGNANATGGSNSFFGNGAGNVNSTGGFNSFFGVAGQLNTTGDSNSFFGYGAGRANTVGISNSFFGRDAGAANTTGGSNAFFGSNAAISNTTGTNNTVIGVSANVGSANLTNATAIGSKALVSQNNSLVLGSINGVNGATADTNVGIGTTNPARPLEIANGKMRFSNPLGDIEFTEVADVIAHATEAVPVATDPAFRVDVGANLTRVFTVLNNGNVGIGTPNPNPFYKLEVLAGSGNAIVGTATNFDGVRGSSTSGTGVSGTSTSGAGVRGDSNSGTGGFFSSFSGTGVDSFGATMGVLARSSSGVGVRAATGSGTTIMEGFAGGVRKFHITNAGTYVAGSDFAEALPARGEKAGYEPGDVLVVSTEASATVEKSSRPYDLRLVGVYSTRPGMLGADKNGTSRVDENELPVAIVGIVPAKVSTENGPVQAGDLLTTSATPGYAMKASPVLVGGVEIYRTGTILGKALEPLKEGKGVIKVLVTLR